MFRVTLREMSLPAEQEARRLLEAAVAERALILRSPAGAESVRTEQVEERGQLDPVC